MRPSVRRISLVAYCAAAIVAVLAGPAAAGSNLSETYPDPIGDAGSGADIGDTTVTFSGGLLTFRIQIANRSTWVSGESVNVFLNTDQNQLNNNLGSDYAIFTNAPSGAVQTQLGRWNPSTQAYDIITPSSFSGSFSNSVIQATVSLADLASLPLIDFQVWSFVPGPGFVEFAPDNLGWFPTFDTRDADSDGVSDGRDVCPTEPAGNFDPNANGCSGPYGRVSAPRPAISAVPVAGGLRFNEAALVFIDRGARVVVRAGRRTQTSIKKARPLVLRIVVGRTLAYGSLITVSITEANEIGWYGQYRVTPRGLKLSSQKCIPPGRTTPASCGSIDRGQ